MKSSPGVIEVVVGPVVHGHTLSRKTVPVVQAFREQRRDAADLVVTEVVSADLPFIVRETVWKRLGLGEQQQPHVLVDVAGHEHDLRRLEVLGAALDVVDAARATIGSDFDRRDVRFGHHRQTLRGLRLGDRRDRRRALGVDVATAARAEAVIGAAGPALIGARIHRGRPGNGCQPSFRAASAIISVKPVPRSGGIGYSRARAPSNVLPRRIDRALDVAGLARHADLELDLVVVRLELLETERPVLDRRSLRYARRAVASRRLADHLEVPRIQPPALRPVVQRRAADGVHHRVNRLPRQRRRGSIRPVCRDLSVGLLHRLRPPAEVVAQLVWREVVHPEPRTGLEADDVEPRLRERQRGDTTRGAETDDDHVSGLEVNGHRASSSRTSRSRTPTCAWAPPQRPCAGRWPWRSDAHPGSR